MKPTGMVVDMVVGYMSRRRSRGDMTSFASLWCDAARQRELRALGVDDDNLREVLTRLPEDDHYVILY